MSKVNILTHFSNPNWPVVNKLRAICRCHDVTMFHCPTLEKLQEKLKEPLARRNLLFTDEGMLDKASEIGLFDLNPRLEIAIFMSSHISAVAQKVTNHKKVKYLLGINHIEEHGRDLSILVKKFAEDDILDLEKYLAFGTRIHKRTISNRQTKAEALNAIHSYISGLGDPGYGHPYGEYALRMVELSDELLLNAVYDANPRMGKSDRSKPFQLSKEEEVQIAWGYDGEFFGISVADPFGRMTSETVMKYLSRRTTAADIIASESAGLGLKFILERAHQVVTNVRQQKVTEVIALSKFVNRILEFETAQKSIYFFGETSSD